MEAFLFLKDISNSSLERWEDVMFRELPTFGLKFLLVLASLDSLITHHQLTAQYYHDQFAEEMDVVWEMIIAAWAADAVTWWYPPCAAMQTSEVLSPQFSGMTQYFHTYGT